MMRASSPYASGLHGGATATSRLNRWADAIPTALPFMLYLGYTVVFFLHVGNRWPAIGMLRPDLAMAMLVGLSLAPYLNDRIPVLKLPICNAIVLLFGWIALSLPFVEWPGSVVRENWQPFLKAVLFLFFTLLVVDTPKRLKIFVAVFVACQVLRVVEPLYLNLTSGYMGSRTHLGGGEFAGRLAGAPSDVINPNGLGFVIAGCIGFLHYLLFHSRKVILKLLYLALVPCFLYTLIQTMSRGGLIALAVAGLVIFVYSRKKGPMIAAVTLGAVIAWGGLTELQKERYLSLVSSDTSQSTTVEGRVRGMENEFLLGFRSPVFGHGLGTTAETKANILRDRQAAHNLYAELIIEIGIPGLIIFLVFMRRVYACLQENKAMLLNSSSTDPHDYYVRLNLALITAFWTYTVYSINYYGLSQDYWYTLGGIVAAYGGVMMRERHNRIGTLS